MANAKVIVTTRFVVDSKIIYTGSKLHDDSATVKLVIDTALEKAEQRAGSSLTCGSVEACQSEAALEGRGNELDDADLTELTVADLRDGIGRWLKVQVMADTYASPLPSATDKLMQTQQLQSRALPTPPEGERYEFRLFRAILANLQRDNLSFPMLDAGQSGKRMLTALSQALQYVLPFDEAEPSPLRLAGRIQLVVPKRFSTQVCASRPPFQLHCKRSKHRLFLPPAPLPCFSFGVGIPYNSISPPPPPPPVNGAAPAIDTSAHLCCSH
jgi:hypothetical protein